MACKPKPHPDARLTEAVARLQELHAEAVRNRQSTFVTLELRYRDGKIEDVQDVRRRYGLVIVGG